MTDHKAEAESLIEPLGGEYTDFDRVQFVAQAQVHATLALAEQERIKNLMRFVDVGVPYLPSGHPYSEALMESARARIFEGLGLA